MLVRTKGGEVDYIPGTGVDYMDVSPRQMVSVATAMITNMRIAVSTAS